MEHAAFLADVGAEAPPLGLAEVLEVEGWAVLRGLLDRELLGAARLAFESSPRVAETSGTRHMERLLACDPTTHAGAEAFEAALLQPRLMSAVQALLGRPFRLLHYGGRDPLPGYGRQGLHTDWPPRSEPGPPVAATALVLLDDFRPDDPQEPGNGATRLVPGTHRLPGMVPRSLARPGAAHPDELQVEARAGDALVFSAHLWHAAGLNRSRGKRRVLQAQFVVRDNAPPAPVPAGGAPREAEAPWLSAAAAALLG
jgi:hypothetical protein